MTALMSTSPVFFGRHKFLYFSSCMTIKVQLITFTIVLTSSRQQSHGLCAMLAPTLQRFARPASRVAFGGQSATLVVRCHTPRSANHLLRARLSSLPQRAFLSTMGGRLNLGSANAANTRVLWSRLAVASWIGPRGVRWASRSEAEYAAPCMPTTCQRYALKLHTVALTHSLHFCHLFGLCFNHARPLVSPRRRPNRAHV